MTKNFIKIKELAKTVELIKKLEKEIKNIEKIAESLANNPCFIDLTMKVEDLKKREDEKSKVSFDEDGSLKFPEDSINMRSIMDRMMSGTYGGFGNPYGKEIEKHKDSYNTILSENLSLRVLSLIVKEKTAEYNKLIAELNDIKL